MRSKIPGPKVQFLYINSTCHLGYLSISLSLVEINIIISKFPPILISHETMVPLTQKRILLKSFSYIIQIITVNLCFLNPAIYKF